MAAIDEILASSPSACYVFDAGVLRDRIRFLQTSLPAQVTLCYAVKANPFIVGEAARVLDKFEICSPGEAAVCKAANLPSEQMVISGVYKTPEYIESLVSDPGFGGVFTVESMSQYRLLCGLSARYGRTVPVLLRLTNGSQFGINGAEIEEILRCRSANPGIRCLGIQYFSGTQKFSLKKIRREIGELDQFLIHLRDDLGFNAEQLEYGPGFPYPYFDGEEFDETAYLAEFSAMLGEMAFRTDITLELGRSIAASCGRYFTHIVDIKRNKGMNYAIVDGGMHHLVYFGQQMAMKRPKLSVIGKTGGDGETLWNICGSLCSMNDILVKQTPLPEIAPGDIICFENTGAYCMTEGIALFLTRDIPAVWLVREDGSADCIRGTFETSLLNTPNKERMADHGQTH